MPGTCSARPAANLHCPRRTSRACGDSARARRGASVAPHSSVGGTVPTVSIVIPTYNRQRLVQETIDSVLRQSFSDWELLVIDDGSTDETATVLTERYGNSIRYVHQQNQGESAARNKGITLAQGKYVAFLDSDDLWLPNKLQRQVEVLDSQTEVGLVSTQAYWMSNEGLQLQRPPHGHDRASATVSWADLVLGNAIAGGGSSAMVRRRCFELAGTFDASIRFGEEWDLWLRIARHWRVYQIPEPLCCYRINPGGARTWAPRPDEVASLHLDHLDILKKAFADCPDVDSACEDLQGQALSREYLRTALVYYGLGNVEQGHEHWLTAIRHCPEYATDRDVLWQQITNAVAGYANVAEPGSRIRQAKGMLERIFSRLPEQVTALREHGNELTARILVELAFAAAQKKESKVARRCALESLVRDPRWIQNVGMVKILLTGGRHLWPKAIDWQKI